jgi:hypothetical protein
MKNTFKLAAALPLCAALFGCGGGGGSGSSDGPAITVDPGKVDTPQVDPGKTNPTTTDPTQVARSETPAGSAGSADGIWVGVDKKTGAGAFALVSAISVPDARYAFYVGFDTGTTGYVSPYSGAMTVKDRLLEDADVNARENILVTYMHGRIDAAHTMIAEFDWGDPTYPQNEYALTYSSESLKPSGLDQLQGSYAGAAPAGQSGAAPSITIDAQGKLVGHLSGCELEGTVDVQDATRNMYTLRLNVTPVGNSTACLGKNARVHPGDAMSGTAHLSGIAALVTLPNNTAPSLILGARSYDNSEAMFAEALQKQ